MNRIVFALAAVVCAVITVPFVTAQSAMTDEEMSLLFSMASAYRSVGQLEGQLEMTQTMIDVLSETDDTSALGDIYNGVVDQYNELADNLNALMEEYFGDDVPSDLILSHKSYI
jgi:hypothetical protein